jgi:hypothetical protein
LFEQFEENLSLAREFTGTVRDGWRSGQAAWREATSDNRAIWLLAGGAPFDASINPGWPILCVVCKEPALSGAEGVTIPNCGLRGLSRLILSGYDSYSEEPRCRCLIV